MDAVTRFLAYRRRVCATGTVTRTKYALDRWVTFLVQRGKGVEQADSQDVFDYISTWTWSPLTKSQHISVLRVFYAWLCRQGLAASNPWSDVRSPRKPVRVPRVLSQQEFDAICRALGEPTTRDLRDRALVLFLGSTGCRIGEALGLDMDDLDIGRREAVVLGKGNRERVVFFDRDTATALKLWITVGRPRWARTPSGPVFIGRHGDRLTYHVARYALIRAERSAGLPRHIHPHLLRHTFATEAVDRGMDLRTLQALLGHSRLDTTGMYLHVARDRLRSQYDAVFAKGEGKHELLAQGFRRQDRG